MLASIRRFFVPSSMIKPNAVLGELPGTREAYQNVIRIALPSVAEMVLTSLIGFADTAMVGSLGPEAIAAVGLTGQPRMLMLSIFFALNIGVTAIVARRKGEGDQADANRTLRNGILLILSLAFFMMILSVTLARPLMLMAGAKPETVDMAATYFRILSWALPLNALTMCINAAQRGVGNTRVTMFVNIVANIVNIVFNYLLIGGNFGFPRWGVAGAAIASVIGIVVGFIMCVYTIFSHRGSDGFLRLSFHDDWRMNKQAIKAISKVGSAAMVEQIALRIGFFAYALIVASLGTAAFAAHTICMQFLNISFTFGDGIGVAGTSLVGQMLGRKRPDLSMIYGKVSQRIALCAALILMSILITFRHQLPIVFLDQDSGAEVLALASQVLLVVAMFQPFQTSSVVISGCLRGAGDTKYVAWVMILCVAFIRPLVSLFMIHVLHVGLVGAWMASLVDIMVRLTCVYIRFSSGKWAKIKV